jgi:hypothetical protein
MPVVYLLRGDVPADTRGAPRNARSFGSLRPWMQYLFDVSAVHAARFSPFLGTWQALARTDKDLAV